MTNHPGKRAFLAQLKRELARERYEERAAIMEYDGGLPREEAERRAKESAEDECDGFVRYPDGP